MWLPLVPLPCHNNGICDSLFTKYEPVSNYLGTLSMHVFPSPATPPTPKTQTKTRHILAFIVCVHACV